MDIRTEVGRRIRKRRLAAGLTQAELSERLGMSRRYIGGIEKGEYNPTVEIVARIAAALGCRPKDLLP